MEISVERFPRREGQIFLLDLARRAGADMGRRSGRLVFRERFRLFSAPPVPGVEGSGVERRGEPGIQPSRRRFTRVSAPRAARLGGHCGATESDAAAVLRSG